jgi:hypothetical protein
MGRLTDLIESLLDNSDGHAHDRRVNFFTDPLAYCEPYGLEPEQLAVLFTMDPKLIHNYLLPNEGTDLYALMKTYEGQMDGEQWPKPGEYALDPWRTDPPSCDEPPDSGPGIQMKILWSGPHPGIQQVLTPLANRGQPFDLKISGEGLLPNATMELAQGGIIFRFFATDYHACSFARTYLRAKIDKFPVFLPTGTYRVRVRNPVSPILFEARQTVEVS